MRLPLILLGATLSCLVYAVAARLIPPGLASVRRTSGVLAPVDAKLDAHLQAAGLRVSGRTLLWAMVAAGAGGGLLAVPFRSGLLTVVAIAVCGSAPYQAMRARARARGRAIAAATEPALVQIARLCEVRHHPFLALTDAVPMLGGPLQPEFERALAETQAGLPLPEALRQMAVRCGDDFYLHQLAELVAIHIRAGGDLAGSLSRLAGRLRTMAELQAEESAELFGYRWLTRILYAAALLPLAHWGLTGSPSFQLFVAEPVGRGVLVWVVLSGLAIASLPYWLAIDE